MLQNDSINDWLNLVKTKTAKNMQSLSEIRLNPHNHHLSPEAKKRLVWLNILYYDHGGNVSVASQRAGISRQWMSHLKQLFEFHNKDPRSLEPASRSPRNCSQRNKIPQATENLIIQIRDDSLNVWGKEKIAYVLRRDYGIKVNHNTINKYLHKHKRICPKISLKNEKAFQNKKLRETENLLLKVKFRPPTKLKDYAPGALVEKDMKYLAKPKPKYAGKHHDNYWYQFTETDSFTRIRTLEISDEQNTAATIYSHEQATNRFPFKTACINTDNGFENNNSFSAGLKKENVFHFYSNRSTPTDNPRVERSHLTDDVEFYLKGNIFNDLQRQKDATRKWEDFYNLKRPHQALSYLTPMEFYLLWKNNPEKAYAITRKWQGYLKRQRLRLASARKIKKRGQIDTLMNFIDTKLQGQKGRLEDAKLQLINCKLCSIA